MRSPRLAKVDRWNRNFSLAQVATEFTGHVRTSATAGNAEPSLATAVPLSAATFIAAARTPARDCAVIYLPVGGTVRIHTGSLRRGLTAEWFDPRTARRRAAQNLRGRFTAPDARDWVLVFHP